MRRPSALAIRLPTSLALRPGARPSWRNQLLLFAAAYVVYNVARAAVPSLHVGFAVAIGVALALAVRAPWAKALALAWGPVVSLSVIATGNHYVFDIAAGLAVTALGFAADRLPERLAPPRGPLAPRRATA